MLRFGLDVLMGVTTLLGTPLSVTAVKALSVAPQPASASECSFQIFIQTLTGKTMRFQAYGSNTVEEVKQMVQDTEGKGLGTACKGNWGLSVQAGRGYTLNVSLFERLVLSGVPHTSLAVQHRMQGFPRSMKPLANVTV